MDYAGGLGPPCRQVYLFSKQQTESDRLGSSPWDTPSAGARLTISPYVVINWWKIAQSGVQPLLDGSRPSVLRWPPFRQPNYTTRLFPKYPKLWEEFTSAVFPLQLIFQRRPVNLLSRDPYYRQIAYCHRNGSVSLSSRILDFAGEIALAGKSQPKNLFICQRANLQIAIYAVSQSRDI